MFSDDWLEGVAKTIYQQKSGVTTPNNTDQDHVLNNWDIGIGHHKCHDKQWWPHMFNHNQYLKKWNKTILSCMASWVGTVKIVKSS